MNHPLKELRLLESLGGFSHGKPASAVLDKRWCSTAQQAGCLRADNRAPYGPRRGVWSGETERPGRRHKERPRKPLEGGIFQRDRSTHAWRPAGDHRSEGSAPTQSGQFRSYKNRTDLFAANARPRTWVQGRELLLPLLGLLLGRPPEVDQGVAQSGAHQVRTEQRHGVEQRWRRW